MRYWTVLIPVKRLAAAKSRLRAHHRFAASAGRLALAFAMDTARAAACCRAVERLIVVSADPAVAAAAAAQGFGTAGEGPRPGLNPALAHAAAGAADAPVCALTGDLPALRPAELAEALSYAGHAPRAYVPDAAGTGTVLLAATAGRRLDPRFGPGSARAHADSGAVELTGRWPGLRRDVDTPSDLAAAGAIGVGERTRGLIPAG